jgi:hypothetical protein
MSALTGQAETVPKSAQQYYDRRGVARLARERGLSHITENSVETAAYRRDKPLKRTKINGRIYYKLDDIEAWLAGVAL